MTVIFIVKDMTCGHCEKTVRNALAEALPDAPVSIDLVTHTVMVGGDEAKAAEAIRQAGYSPERAKA